MPVAVPPMQQAQLSARRQVEVREAPGRTSLGKHLFISGATHFARTSQSLEGITSEISTLQPADSNGKTNLLVPILRWSAALEETFAHAAARMAAGNVTNDERAEFASLQNSRRRVYLARPGKDVLRDFEERQRTADLVSALKRYVDLASG